MSVPMMPSASPAVMTRADELFHEQFRTNAIRVDRLFVRLLIAEWIACIIVALVVSPRTWNGAESSTHPHVLAAAVLGGLLITMPVILAAKAPGALLTRHVIAASQMFISALLIHLTGGRIETHFHVFGSLALLAFYRDWTIFVTATVIVGLDHLLRGIYWPQSVYGVAVASPWRTLEHAWWVIFENTFLISSCIQSLREMKVLALRQAALEDLFGNVEREVEEKTASLRESQERFRALSEASPVGIFQEDAQGVTQYINQRIRDLAVVIDVAALEKDWVRMLDAFSRKEFRELLATKRDAARINHEVRLRSVDGSPRWAMVRLQQTVDAEGHFSGYVGVVEETSATKKAELQLSEYSEELQQAMDIEARNSTELQTMVSQLAQARDAAEAAARAKDVLLTHMSRELRTPLDTIIGTGESLLQGTWSEGQMAEASAGLERITTSGKQLLGIVNDILALSRLEAGKTMVSLERIDVVDLVESVVQTARPAVLAKGASLTADCDLGCGMILTDNARLRQVLLMLIAHACHVDERGAIELIAQRKIWPNGEWVRFEVRNTSETAGKVQPGGTELDTSSSEFIGTGLAIAKRLCDLLGATMESQTDAGHSSSVIVVWPASPPRRVLAANAGMELAAKA